jgi:hypothetical protein
MSCFNKLVVPSSARLPVFGILVASMALPMLGQGYQLCQGSQEERHNCAVALFRSTACGEVERACAEMQKLVQEAPSNTTYHVDREVFCNQAQLARETEGQRASEGIQRANSGNCSEARVYYEQILHNSCRDSSNSNRLKAALDACQGNPGANPVAGNPITHPKGGPDSGKPHAIARNPITHPKGGPDSGEPHPIPRPMGNSTSDEQLRAGLKAYFSGDLATAEVDLTKCLSTPGDHEALAYFFRGATRLSRFYLSGEKDGPFKNSAAADFQILKTRYKSYHPPTQYVSPKILDVYNAQP